VKQEHKDTPIREIRMDRYRAMSMEEKLALYIVCSVEPVDIDSRYELEELQLFTWDRLTTQERADALRRAKAMVHMLKAEHLVAVDPPAELMLRIDRVVSAPIDIWNTGDIIGLLKQCGDWFKSIGPVKITAGQLAKVEADKIVAGGPGIHMLPVDKCSPADVLRMFRAFVLRNVAVWQMGAGDHHHPIWEHVAVNVDGDDPTSGPEYAYLQPLNRKSLGVLRLEYEDMMDARAAGERGG
jgi:hypothetical protein